MASMNGRTRFVKVCFIAGAAAALLVARAARAGDWTEDTRPITVRAAPVEVVQEKCAVDAGAGAGESGVVTSPAKAGAGASSITFWWPRPRLAREARAWSRPPVRTMGAELLPSRRGPAGRLVGAWRHHR